MSRMTAMYTNTLKRNDKLPERGRIQEEPDAWNFEWRWTEIERGIRGLDDIGRDHAVAKMSGGQRSKIILANYYWKNPDVILLDEPTNYYGLHCVSWRLSEYLTNTHHFMIMIFTECDEFVSSTWLSAKLPSIGAALSKPCIPWTEKANGSLIQQVVIEKAERFIRKNKAGSKSTMAKSREKMLNRLDRVDPPSTNVQAHFDFPYQETGSQNALVVDELSVGYDRPLLKPVTFSVTTDQKVGLTGFNGVGKSTLIKSILGIIKAKGGEAHFSPSARISYFSRIMWDNNQNTATNYPSQIREVTSKGDSHEVIQMWFGFR